ncbi:uncharacterized protein LOC132260612 [Phlebotomus argentipes]|uniref:uncharacterized protein LOC132260612 n=1 Tax=Phlebotomus argentipes TaxID=94469 RepID=UPI002892E2CB|nr:uncharacterized protein LOC132260612 [Phlebotomus argentipes]XP_059614833.1 uncharacterized protein LOC132260612 [Phlebotomus argentipes]
MAQFYVVQNSDDNECYIPAGIRFVNLPDDVQFQPQSRLILTEPVIADQQMQYVYQRPATQQVAQTQQTQFVIQDDDIVTDSFTSHQIYVSADASNEMIQRQLQHSGIVQQNQEQQQQVIIQQSPPTNRVILQSSPSQPVIVHQSGLQAQTPVVLNSQPQLQQPQRQFIYDSTGQRPIYAITTPAPQPQMQPRPQQQLRPSLIVRPQQRPQIRMQQPTLTYQARPQTPSTTVIQQRASIAQTRVSMPQPRLSIASPVRQRYRPPVPRSQVTVSPQRPTRPTKFTNVSPRPQRVLNAGLVRMSPPERAASFSGTPRPLTPLAKVNRTFPVAAAPKPQTTVPTPASKLEVRNIVPTAQSSSDPNGDLEESITASILEKSQITLNLPDGATKAEEFTDGALNGGVAEIKKKVVRTVDTSRGRGRGQIAAARPGAKRPVNQSVQDLFNSVSSDVEQQNQQMLLTQSSPECETRESAKMLVILQCGEQRLITFTLPKESCTVQELLEQVGVPFTPDTNIQCVSNPGANIDYVVTVGDPVQEVVPNNLIGAVEQQEQTSQPQRTPVRPPVASVGQFATSTPVQRAPTFSTPIQPQLTPIKSAPTAPEPPKPPERKIIQGWLAVCGNCGFCGIDHAKCERCNHILGDSPKRIPCSTPKPTPPTMTPPVRTPVPALLQAQPKVTKQFVRIQKDAIATPKKLELVKKPELARSVGTATTSTLTNSLPAAPVSAGLIKAADRIGAKPRGGAAVRGRGRTAKPTEPQEPIILTLSSDDEEDEKSKTQTVAKKQVAEKVAEVKALACEPVITEKTSPIKGDQRLSITDLSNVPDKLMTSIQCQTIRIGTLQYEPKEQVILSSRGVRIIAPSVKNPKENIILDVQIKEIVKIIAHFPKKLPILFIYTTPSCAQYIRNSLDMASNATSGPYFDPCTKHESVRRITILAEVITDETKSVIKSLYSTAELEEITFKDANELYKRSTMKLTISSSGSNVTSADEGAGSEDVHQILIYPQGKGGISINTEDYKCLAIDQYLNDVIIDFFLNYLRLSIFTEEQRAKTHICSSFFYKRLTAMSTRQRQMEKDLKMTASQKRHHRVKGWTKSVNLFEKDFIIIPINEQSHWFLAIVCFPGLKGPQTFDGGVPVKVAPLVKKKTSDGEKKVSVTIGNTTITPLTKKEEAIFLNDDSMSERDEAEADESDMESEESEPEADPDHQAIKQPCILIFDSLAGGYRSRVVATLRDYLTCEYKAKILPTSNHTFNKDNMPGHSVKVPQQNNFTDCGLYLLQYVQEFFANPIKDYRLPIKQLQNWFSTIVVTRKREEISNLLMDLVKESHPERLDLLPVIQFPTQDGKLIETEENFEETAEFEEEELDDPNFEMEDEETDGTEEESPEKKNGRKLIKRTFDKSEKNSPEKKIPRTN